MTPRDVMLILGLSLLWGGSFLFVELALPGFAPFTLVWLRVALAALILLCVLRATGTALPPRPVWGALLVMGLLNNALPFSAFAFAQGSITGALASVLNATTPLFTVLVAHAFTADERLTPAKTLGLALGLGGVVVMLSGKGLSGTAAAMALCLAAAFCYGLAGVWGRRFRRLGLPPLATAFGQLAASSLLLAPLMLTDRPFAQTAPGLTATLAILGLAALSTALAYVVYFRVLASAGATSLALVTFLIPVSATMLGFLVLGERLALNHLTGFALVALGLIAIDGRMLTWWTRPRAAR